MVVCFQLLINSSVKLFWYFIDFLSTLKHPNASKIAWGYCKNCRSWEAEIQTQFCALDTKESFIIVRFDWKSKLFIDFRKVISLQKSFSITQIFLLVWPIFSSSQLSKPCTTSSLTFTILELVLGYLKNWVWIPKNWFLVKNSIEIHEIGTIEMYLDLMEISCNPKRHFWDLFWDLGFHTAICIINATEVDKHKIQQT